MGNGAMPKGQVGSSLLFFESAQPFYPREIEQISRVPVIGTRESVPFAESRLAEGAGASPNAAAQAVTAYPRSSLSEDPWVSGVSLTLLLLLSFVALATRRTFLDYLQRFGSMRLFTSQSLRAVESTTPLERQFYWFADACWLLTAAYMLWRGLLFYCPDCFGGYHPLLGLAFCLMALLVYTGLRVLTLTLAGRLTRDRELGISLLENMSVGQRMLWVPLLVAALLSTYTTPTLRAIFFWVGGAIVVVVLLSRWLRLALAFRHRGGRVFYYFLYICAVEMFPLLLLLKMIVSWL